jgi:rRNA-processing protein FCF1
LRKVLLDSSFLMAVMEHPTTWQGDITQAVGKPSFVILQSVKAELERISKEGSKRAKLASLALGLTRDGTIGTQPDRGGRPDDEIVSSALSDKAAVAAIDSELVARLRALGITTITLRGGRVEART